MTWTRIQSQFHFIANQTNLTGDGKGQQVGIKAMEDIQTTLSNLV